MEPLQPIMELQHSDLDKYLTTYNLWKAPPSGAFFCNQKNINPIIFLSQSFIYYK